MSEARPADKRRQSRYFGALGPLEVDVLVIVWEAEPVRRSGGPIAAGRGQVPRSRVMIMRRIFDSADDPSCTKVGSDVGLPAVCRERHE
jgi:hypothetical protein